MSVPASFFRTPHVPTSPGAMRQCWAQRKQWTEPSSRFS
jgi:hypothetical protein